MASLVEEQRKELEARGEYVILANIDWFAVSPKTLERREALGRTRGRAQINLVVYRTRTGQPRDHHVIPIAFARQLLSDATLGNSMRGSKRWNMVLSADTDRLKVTHGDRELNVVRFRGVPLITEVVTTFDPAEPVEERDKLEARVNELHALSDLARPVGTPYPRRLTSASYSPIARRPDVKAWVLRQACGRCELCGLPAPFRCATGPYLEHHHVVQLAHGGADTVENSVAVCPNCHRRLHVGDDRDMQRTRLYEKIARLLKGAATSDEPG
jgi:5-methylcytosine-specific restriction endonuclease McrA